jgi:hypothetical protein
MDGAAVLQYSIRNATGAKSKYRYQFYAIYHPNATACAQSLGSLGYVMMEREFPVQLLEIRNPFYRGILPRSGTSLGHPFYRRSPVSPTSNPLRAEGCCGEKELLKFEAFLLTQHPVVVLVDMDVLVLKPLDDILDLIIFNKRPPDDEHSTGARHLMWPQRKIPEDIWLLYVNDYALVYPEDPIKPTQGGFAVFKPNRTIYDDIVNIVRDGDYHPDLGWRNQSGVFWGSTTYQGLMAYYFQISNPGHEVELHYCSHNNMKSPNGEVRDGVRICYSGQPVEACDDCRARSVADVSSAHFTVCGKPWECWDLDEGENRLCKDLQRSWFRARSDMEKSWGRSGRGNATGRRKVEQFCGYCKSHHFMGYEPIQQPYGTSGVAEAHGEIQASIE